MTRRTNRVSRKRWKAAGAALVLLAPGAFAADAPLPDGEPGDVPNPYSGYSDQELSDLGARWESLGDDQRRWLFIETRKRMVANGERIRLQVTGRARFGRVLRDSDGSLLRLETLHVNDRANPEVAALPAVRAGRKEVAPVEAQADVEDEFGTGFERRRTDTEVAPDARAERPAPPDRSGKRGEDQRS